MIVGICSCIFDTRKFLLRRHRAHHYSAAPENSEGGRALTLKDETGSFNAIVSPALLEQVHRTVMMAAALLVRDELERVGETAYTNVVSVEPLDHLMAQANASGIPSRSYSY